MAENDTNENVHLEDIMTVEGLLKAALDMNFETVIIIGYSDTNELYIQNSATVDRLKLIGALEAAKVHIWQEG